MNYLQLLAQLSLHVRSSEGGGKRSYAGTYIYFKDRTIVTVAPKFLWGRAQPYIIYTCLLHSMQYSLKIRVKAQPYIQYPYAIVLQRVVQRYLRFQRCFTCVVVFARFLFSCATG